MEYQKINTLFKRDANNIIIPSQYTIEEFYYLRDNLWECTEKIDGTSMRVELIKEENNAFSMQFKGRTDKAQIPSHLLDRMHELFDSVDWNTIFPNLVPKEAVTLYGEGYGTKIQSGGNYISDGVDFILFDIRIGNWWLKKDICDDIADILSIKRVPFMGYMTIPEAVEFVKKGFKSTIAENKDYDAEGLVLKTPNGLRLRNGERIITKIKTCDFRKFTAKYGNDYTGPQPENTYYGSN